MIINNEHYYFLESNGSLSPRNSGCFSPAKFHHWNEGLYWMIEFIQSEPFKHISIENITGSEIFKKMLNGEVILMIVHISEAYHYVIDDLYKALVIDQKIPAKNILYLTNSADIELEIEAISEKYGLPKMQSMYMASYECGANINLKRDPEYFDIEVLDDKIYEKKFLSLNGLWRPHRMLLGAFLTGSTVIDKGYISLNSITENMLPPDEMFDEMLRWCKDNQEGTTILLENKEEIKKLSKLYIDDVTDPTLERPAYTTLSSSYYTNTYFSIVTETLAWKEQACGGVTTGRALSEKTFKPILFKHPFLLIALPGALQLLRDLGYKTFSDCMDESYDTETDDSKRVYLVTKEAERLCNLSASELKDFLKICREITNYNFEVLKNKQQFLYKKT